MTAGTSIGYLRNFGGKVKRGEIIAKADTDKGVIEIAVFQDGTIEIFEAKKFLLAGLWQ